MSRRAAGRGPRPRQALPAHARRHLPPRIGAVRAVDGVSFDVLRGETLGHRRRVAAAASRRRRGCCCACSSRRAGSITLRGRGDHRTSRARELKALRREMQMIFQDPYSSLNPRKTVGTIIGEPFAIHGMHRPARASASATVQELMERVGLNPEHYNRYPHEFSGGQRQRIGVARALALRAEADRRRRAGLRARRLDPGADPQPAARAAARARPDARLHRPRPLGRAPHVRPHRGDVPRQDRRARVGASELYAHPRHPYTGALLSAVPVADPRLAAAKQRQVLGGDVPSPTNPPAGLPLPHPLLEGAGGLPRRRARARDEGGRQPRRLPLPAHRRGGGRAGADGAPVR